MRQIRDELIRLIEIVASLMAGLVKAISKQYVNTYHAKDDDLVEKTCKLVNERSHLARNAENLALKKSKNRLLRHFRIGMDSEITNKTDCPNKAGTSLPYC